jgi:DNA-binding SARP family transcriptional activator/tetratricopeptide (TPR) repeat protein
MAAFQLALLGTFEARLNSGPVITFSRRKCEALLAYLAVHPDQVRSRHTLAALLWGDAPDERARHSLRQALVAVRRALPDGDHPLLVEEGETLALYTPAVDVDVPVFERLVAEGSPEALEQAVRLYRGDLLEGIGVDEPPFEEWLLTERQRLRDLAVEMFTKLLACQTRIAAIGPAVRTAVSLLGLDPTQEWVHRTLMRLYGRQGRRAAALRQYEVCVEIVRRELGLEPEEETRRLYQELVAGTGTAGGSMIPRRVGRSPGRRETATTPRPPVTSPSTPMIGREAERARLHEFLRLARRGQGQLVLVLGEAGIGKTRLVGQFTAEAARRGVLVLEGRARESEQVVALAPWLEIVRSCLERGLIADSNSLWRLELAGLLPGLAEPQRNLATAPDDTRGLFLALTEVVTDASRQQPVVLVLEDLHWADETTLRLLAFLSHRAVTSRTLVIATARDEELPDATFLQQVLFELDRDHRSIALTLRPLSSAETFSLVRAVMPAGRPESDIAELGRLVWKVSEGNPFVIEETVRALQEQPTSSTDGVVLPRSVQQVIARRLERLSGGAQDLLAAAAVIGREFEFAMLRHVTEFDELEAAKGVEEMVRRCVLREAGERFDFVHDRIRDVAYQRLLSERRRLLHRRVARAIEALHPADLDQYCGALARHYRAARDWPQAARYLGQAGHQASARAAHRDAVRWYEQALDALAQVPRTRERIQLSVDVRLDLRNSLLTLGDADRGLGYLREAEVLAGEIEDEQRLGRVRCYLTYHLFRMGQFEHAIATGQQALAIASGVKHPTLAAETVLFLGQTYYTMGEYRGALRFLLRSGPPSAEELDGDRFGRGIRAFVFSRCYAASSLAALGRFAEGIARGCEGLRVAEVVDSPHHLCAGLVGLGDLHLRRGDFDVARPLLERALELCRSSDFAAMLSWVASSLGSVSVAVGRATAGLALLEEAAELAVRHKGGFGHASSLCSLARGYAMVGRWDEAGRVAGEALEHSRRARQRGYEGHALLLLGQIAADRAETATEQAEAWYRSAMSLADELGMRPLVAHCYLGLGKLYRSAGNLERARRALTTATTMYGEMGMRFWLEKAEAELKVQ